jgi:hypothetical protein
LESTSYFTVPLPVPLALPMTWSQGALAVAVQLHAAPAVTFRVPFLTPLAGALALVGAIEIEHPPA